MTVTPTITIYVRHGKDSNGKPCKYSHDEFAKRCDCRKYLRWSQGGVRHRRKANTRSWAEAERARRELEDQFTGEKKSAPVARDLPSAISVYLTDKTVQGVAENTLSTYSRELDRLKAFCDKQLVFNVHGVDRELLTKYMATWDTLYPSSVTRSKVRERLRGFLRYCYEAEWLPRIPVLPKIKVDKVPTLPLTAKEFNHLLTMIPVALSGRQISDEVRTRVRALFLLMRWSGLAISDALLLKRSAIVHTGEVYRVVTSRQKTGVDVSVPIPPVVAKEVLAVPNPLNPKYLFWSGKSKAKNHATKWQTRFILPVFQKAGLATGTMMSHRLRDTFAVDLLQKGIPLEEVSKLLGHVSLRTTEKSYSAWVKGRQDRLDSLVMGSWA